MPRKAVSVTLDEGNLTWLKGRGRGNLSAAIDDLITAARGGRQGIAPAVRSVVGTIDLPPDDPDLERAHEAIAELFATSLARPLGVAGARATSGPAPRRKRSRRRG